MTQISNLHDIRSASTRHPPVVGVVRNSARGSVSFEMWLINTSSLLLESVLEPRNVQYAILSHTWEQDEVSLQDFGNLDFARRKAGFSKIEKTCQIAKSRGLKYAWVDTCCIDKTSSAELTEAINSMFEWYKQAQVCFAFISDLPSVVAGGPMLDWLAGGDYRWFSRGLTLQELIAPQRLEFFDSAWQPRGDRFTLRSGISQKSEIDMPVLQSSACLPGIPVGRKMSWASARTTTRVEDMAYCLLGIFNINMYLPPCTSLYALAKKVKTNHIPGH